jgi:hypothetical protein
MILSNTASFNIQGYPLASIRAPGGNIGIYDGEGYFHLFDRNGAQLGQQRLSRTGFSDVREFEGFSILQTLEGKFFYSDFRTPLQELRLKIRHPTLWKNKIYFLQLGKLYHWSPDASFPEKVNAPEEIQLIWPCGDLLLLMTHAEWMLLDDKGDIELLTNEVLPFTSCTFLPKNSTFHFILPMGEMGFIDIKRRGAEPMVTQSGAPGVKILGTTASDQVAMSYANQLVFLKAQSDRYDEYMTTTVDTLPGTPLRACHHPSRPLSLVMEDANTAALWEAGSGQCLWRSAFEANLCYMNLRERDFLLGLTNGYMASFSF